MLLFVCLFICVVNCKVLSIVDDIPQTKVDLVWESEPKYNGKIMCVCVRTCALL